MATTGGLKRMILTALLTLGLAAVAYGCSCMPGHSQQRFCDAKFAMRVVVKGYEVDSKHWLKKYFLHRTKIFKSSPEFEQVAQKNVLYTSAMGSMCGVDLKDKHKYFITGYVVNGQLRVNLCNWVESWASIPHRQKRLIRHTYSKYCHQCKVKTCFRCKGAKSHAGLGECNWVYSSKTAQCYDRFAVCKCKGAPSVPSRCRWSYGRRNYSNRLNDFSECYKAAQNTTKT